MITLSLHCLASNFVLFSLDEVAIRDLNITRLLYGILSQSQVRPTFYKRSLCNSLQAILTLIIMHYSILSFLGLFILGVNCQLGPEESIPEPPKGTAAFMNH